ncbi:MAG TPA: dTDP-4-amino-4,6-dideoxygalactose transaminase [Bacteroidota bacterium]|nr:dTDP-4-amino-4,6-dideoxygalactose transaminase [Bacteroidota bacterium]
MGIPFHKPYIGERTIDHLRKVLASGKLGGDGPVGNSVEERLTSLFGMKHALLTTSCTHALETAMLTLDLQPGDEVIMPSFTFVSTANAVLRAGGRPIFCEISDLTMTMDPRDLERRRTQRTKGVVPVHYAGVSAPMDEIVQIARAGNFSVVEDAAQGVNARYKGRYLGTIGDCGAYSFHETKNYMSGEGGAFVTNSEEIARKAEIIREKGTNRSNFLRGEVDKYTWVGIGSSFVQSEVLAAILMSQLDDLDAIQRKRMHIHELYVHELRELEQRELLRLPVIPEYASSNYHIFYILLRSEEERIRVMGKLKEEGISTTFHYVPLHSSPYARKNLGTNDLRLPVTDSVFARLLRLPLYPDLGDGEISYIAEKLKAILH